ncbi:MAG: hypothetical protein ACKVS9_03195 [Phycisphaerae bacterium]
MRNFCKLALSGAVGALAVTAAHADEHPFALVNVIDMTPLFGFGSFEPDPNFDPGTPPPNLGDYLASPRIGVNASVIAVDGDRLWVGGYLNQLGYADTTDPDAQRLSWYNSVGVAEIRNIRTTSGFAPADITRLASTIRSGPGLTITDRISGLNYDASTNTLYATFDDASDVNPFFLPSGTVQPNTQYTGIDVDPNSPTYGQDRAGWPLTDPMFTGQSGDRARAGITVDPLSPRRLFVFAEGRGFLYTLDALNPSATATNTLIRDLVSDQFVCSSNAWRRSALDPLTGDLYLRIGNGVNRVYRDTRTVTDPFRTFPRFIREPGSGGNGTCNTLAIGGDDQLVALNAAAAAGTNVVGTGSNGFLDTTPGGDDQFNGNSVRGNRVIKNSSGSCAGNADGYPFGVAQGQGIAYVSSANLVDLGEDLILQNNRAADGTNTDGELKFYRTDGTLHSQLQVPCSPTDDIGSGVAWYDMSYDASTGTLVVMEFQRRLVFVYKAQVDGGDLFPRYDYTRNGRTDMQDYAQLQRLAPDGQTAPGVSLNAMRLNSNSDCDLDADDLAAFVAVLSAVGP